MAKIDYNNKIKKIRQTFGTNDATNGVKERITSESGRNYGRLHLHRTAKLGQHVVLIELLYYVCYQLLQFGTDVYTRGTTYFK